VSCEVTSSKRMVEVPMRVCEFDDVEPLIIPILRHVVTVVLKLFIDALTYLHC